MTRTGRFLAGCCERPVLAAVIAGGALTRVILVPITHGADFTVWDLASRATVNGVNVYAHHPAYSGGPFAYFPLFLYVEVPMQWLALHTGVSFTVFGKLPIVAADLSVTALVVGELRRRGCTDGVQCAGAAAWWLNPLVVYNGAFYGRFDSVCLALLLLAFTCYRGLGAAPWRTCVAYALAVAVKTFPIFVLPWMLHRGRATSTRTLVCCAAVLAAVSAPYLVTSPGPFVTDLLYSAGKLSGGLSWQVVFHGLPTSAQLGIADALLAVFVVGAVALAFVDDWALATGITMVLFALLSKQVIEQYLTWPLPFLVVVAAMHASRAAWLLVAELTAAGMVVNAFIHPFGPFGSQPAVVNVVFAVVVAATLAGVVAAGLRRDGDVPRDRIELSTPGFSDPCSTN